MTFKNINKICIIRNAGSGKSTLAQQLAEVFNLPVHHVDVHFFVSEQELLSDEGWRQKLISMLCEDKWVIEGGGDNLELRLQAAELVIFLDISTYVCLWRVMKRYVRFKFFNKPNLKSYLLLLLNTKNCYKEY
jgi:adenylate kinase family enzyme